jgi:hypothetical protein
VKIVVRTSSPFLQQILNLSEVLSGETSRVPRLRDREDNFALVEPDMGETLLRWNEYLVAEDGVPPAPVTVDEDMVRTIVVEESANL